jgi:hypothetical protein
MPPKTKETQEEIKQPEKKAETTIYWAPASDYQLANFKTKKDADGNITAELAPIRFSECIYVAQTEEECDFIEAHEAFKNNQIIKCANIAEAQKLSAARRAKKSITSFDSEVSVSKTFDKRGQEVAASGQ